ncbi:MAG: hypothetical protein JWL89_186 [Candidatus Saccharibacteria bacterium]|nr:hypothetical protein [Candidatus Saccharibacteria bacterium]
MAKKSGKTVTRRASAKTNTTTQPAVAAQAEPRRIRLGSYKSMRLQKRIKHPILLPNVWLLTKSTARLLWGQKKLFIGITLVYGLLNLVLVQGLVAGTTDVASLKDQLNQVSNGHFSALGSSLSVFVVLVGSAGNKSDQTAGAYQLFLALIGSLAIIWALRQAVAGNVLRIRDAYYRGMYPLVPFILVLAVVGLQLLPLLIGSVVYSAAISGGLATIAAEKLAWGLFYGALALLSLYMVSSSLFALYIVTLPDMTPLKALRSARELVRYRRWTVLRKVLALPVVLLLIAAVVMLPIIILLTPLAQWVFFLLTMFALLGVHSYMYTLYRELLNE